jgi:serine phosphatase RsbU (regulator of sigma subunit)
VVCVAGDTVTVWSAGHPLPLLLRDGAVQHVGAISPMLGVLDEPTLVPGQIELGVRDRLLLYTDGVLDAVGEHDRFGEYRLLSLATELAAAPAMALAERVPAGVDRFARGDRSDDIAVVSLTRTRVPTQMVPA